MNKSLPAQFSLNPMKSMGHLGYRDVIETRFAA
jgi:hypothetical protein